MKPIFVVFSLLIICISVKAQYNAGVIVEPMLKTDTTSIGQKINYPNFANDEVSIMKVTIPPGAFTGWHKHSFPVFAFVLKGTLTIELSEGKTKTFAENTTFA